VPAPATMNVGGGVQAGHNVVYATLTTNANCENNADGRTTTMASAVTNGAGRLLACVISCTRKHLCLIRMAQSGLASSQVSTRP